jgi:hypothetical protein
MLSSGEDVHVEVCCRKASFDLLPDVPVYLRIDLLEKVAPCQLKFSYETNLVDLEVIASFEESIPTVEKCLLRKENPSLMVVYENEGRPEEFWEENLYVALNSKREMRVHLRVAFPF